ncbi:MAG: hypothetical protein KZQ76_03095 [Candidatus Thiodiazotropha sp. (ex Epidulcina cf. delphinae)]|nr:hypothetical protein [Candidatus Thiodiazotropha sp. (ex Epidulcina cf. delphinae)]
MKWIPPFIYFAWGSPASSIVSRTEPSAVATWITPAEAAKQRALIRASLA